MDCDKNKTELDLKGKPYVNTRTKRAHYVRARMCVCVYVCACMCGITKTEKKKKSTTKHGDGYMGNVKDSTTTTLQLQNRTTVTLVQHHAQRCVWCTVSCVLPIPSTLFILAFPFKNRMLTFKYDCVKRLPTAYSSTCFQRT